MQRRWIPISITSRDWEWSEHAIEQSEVVQLIEVAHADEGTGTQKGQRRLRELQALLAQAPETGEPAVSLRLVGIGVGGLMLGR